MNPNRNQHLLQRKDRQLLFGCDLGSSRLWRRQQPGARAAEERSTHPATRHVFAAILESGAVVTWGDPGYGGDSSQVHGVIQAMAETAARCKSS